MVDTGRTPWVLVVTIIMMLLFVAQFFVWKGEREDRLAAEIRADAAEAALAGLRGGR